jgi:hypothetical protein
LEDTNTVGTGDFRLEREIDGNTSVESIEEDFEARIGLEEGFDEWEVEDFLEHYNIVVH